MSPQDEILRRALASIRDASLKNRLVSPAQMDAIEGPGMQPAGAMGPQQLGNQYGDQVAEQLRAALGRGPDMGAISDLPPGAQGMSLGREQASYLTRPPHGGAAGLGAPPPKRNY